MNFKIGYGYDVHRLGEGRKLILGGIEVPHHLGCIGHSDADVLIHAICDALLGAAGLRDIGYHFPDTDNNFKDIDSKILLKRVVELLKEKQFKIGNIDVTLCLQKPKVLPYIPLMQETLTDTMQIDNDQLNIKATTTEKLGFVGTEQGVSCHAAALIEKV